MGGKEQIDEGKKDQARTDESQVKAADRRNVYPC